MEDEQDQTIEATISEMVCGGGSGNRGGGTTCHLSLVVHEWDCVARVATERPHVDKLVMMVLCL
jgi:hypothetical protein